MVKPFLDSMLQASIQVGGVGDTYCIRLSGMTFAFAINSGRIAAENAMQ